jgi:hypothetical protein
MRRHPCRSGDLRPATCATSFLLAPPTTAARPTSRARRRSTKATSFLALPLDPGLAETLALLAVAGVLAYVVFTAPHRARIHPGEPWLIVANAVGLGSGYGVG